MSGRLCPSHAMEGSQTAAAVCDKITLVWAEELDLIYFQLFLPSFVGFLSVCIISLTSDEPQRSNNIIGCQFHLLERFHPASCHCGSSHLYSVLAYHRIFASSALLHLVN